MSRHHPVAQRSRVYLQPSVDNPYKPTTVSVSRQKGYIHRPTNYIKDTHYKNTCSRNTCFSDESFTDTNTYYEYYEAPSDDSGSVRIPQFDYEEISLRRHSRGGYSDRSLGNRVQVSLKNGKIVNNVLVHKDPRRVYPHQSECDRLYQEVLDPRSSNESSSRREQARSRLSDRPQSSQSSAVASTVVDGCGGHCQTFENVCYYFLQVAFTMGVLIGISLCIARGVLRKSAARNLEVLVYIGAMLALVSALLLGVQYNARNSARKRRKAVRNAKRGPIPLEILPSRVSSLPGPVIVDETQRNVPVHQGAASRSILVNPMIEEPGIPWWRRKDLNRK